MSKTKTGYFRQPYHMWLVLIYLAWWIVMAIEPLNFRDWALENMLVAVFAVLFWWAYPKTKLSNLSFTVIAIFMACHTLGSHYTYADVPLGYWLQDLLDLDRNHYDRVIHFSYGLLLFWPFAEISEKVVAPKPKWNGMVSLLFIAGSSAVYETIEWLAAEVVSPDTALAFLGAQGDPFDAQKDHTLALLGGVISWIIYLWVFKRNKLPNTV